MLQKAGVAFGIAGDAETCCGGRAYEMGHEADFLTQAEKSMEVIKQSGAKTLVTSCAVCYQVYNVLYDRFGLKGDLRSAAHRASCIERLLAEGKLSRSTQNDLNVTYHDPCHLGRLGRALDPLEGHEDPRRPLRVRPAQAVPAGHQWRL